MERTKKLWISVNGKKCAKHTDFSHFAFTASRYAIYIGLSRYVYVGSMSIGDKCQD